MSRWMRVAIAPVLLLAALAAGGCATVSAPETRHAVAFATPREDSLASRYAPVFVPEYPGESYNRIGKPSARPDQRGVARVFVDADEAAVYVQERGFETGRGNAYTNLIYRVHFEKVPFSLIPFHLTTGRNSGLLIVVTVDHDERPVLLTTVHTCGCYIAFLPTSYLPRSAWPEDWDPDGQTAFGIRLPGLLEYPPAFDDDYRPLIFTRHGNHRIEHVGVARHSALDSDYERESMEMLPIDALKQLPLNGGTTSFYYDSGFREGYVKGASKPLELLLMSWWVFDPHVGVDKEYGPRNETGTVFYTSLRPWRRSASDMWRFAEFLEFWGWKL